MGITDTHGTSLGLRRSSRGRRRTRAVALAAAAAVSLALFDQRARAQATATWNGGNGSWSTTSNWSGGVVPTSVTAVFIDGGKSGTSAVSLNTGATIGSLTIDAGDVLSYGGFINGLTIAGAGATVNGTLDLSGGSLKLYQQSLYFSGTGAQTLGGTGTVNFGTSSVDANFLSNFGAGTNALTIGAGLTLQGTYGQINGGSGGIVNLGTILSSGTTGGGYNGNWSFYAFTNAGTLHALNGGTLQMGGTNWHNAGVITVDRGSLDLTGAFKTDDLGTINRTAGTLSNIFISGALDNTGRTLNLESSPGEWIIRGSGSVTGGTISSSQPGTFLAIEGVNTTFDGVTLAAQLQFQYTSLNVRNGLTLAPGTVLDLGYESIYDTGGFIRFTGNADQTIGGSGAIYLGTDNTVKTFPKDSGTARITIGGGVLLHGKFGTLVGPLLNQGTVAADVAGGAISLSDVTNTGSLWASNGGTIALGGRWHNDGVINVASGTAALGGLFTFADIGTLNRLAGTNSSVAISQGSIDNTGRVLSLDASTGSWTLRNGGIIGGTVTATAPAQLQVAAGAYAIFDGVTLATSPTFIGATTTVYVRHGLTFAPGGKLDFANGTNNLASNDSLIFNGGGDQTVGGTGEINFGGFAFNGSASVISNGCASTTVTFGPGVFIHGKSLTFNGPFVNQGTIAADVPGGGAFSFSNVTNAGTIVATNGASVTTTGSFYNAPGALVAVSGGGNLALGNAFTNAGTVNVTGGALTLGGGGQPWHNGGVINVAGGTVNLAGRFTWADLGTLNRTNVATLNVLGLLDNTGQTLTIDDSTGNIELRGGTIRGGTIVSAGTARLVFRNYYQYDTLDNVTLATSPLVADGGGNVYVRNDLTLANGAVFNLATIAQVFLTFQGTGNTTLGGAGEVTFGTGQDSQISTSLGTGNHLTIGPGILIHGKGGGIIGPIVNQGTIAADIAGGTMTVSTFTNLASMVATGGATLALGGAWDNSAGAITLYPGATLNMGGTFAASNIGSVTRMGGATGNTSVNVTGTLNNAGNALALDANTGSYVLAGGTISGGTVTAGGGAQLLIKNANPTLDGVTLAAGPVFISPNGTLRVTRGLTLAPGTVLDFTGPGGTNATSPFTLGFAGTAAQSLAGAGELRYGAFFNLLNSASANAPLTIGPGLFLHGQGVTISGGPGGLLNQGTIAAGWPGDLPGVITIVNASNAGSVIALNGASVGALNLANLPAGVVSVTGGGTLSFTGGFTNAGAVYLGAGPGGGTNTLSIGSPGIPWHNTGSITGTNVNLVLNGVFTTDDLANINRGGGNAPTIVGGALSNVGRTLTLSPTNLGSFLLAGGTVTGGTVLASGGAQLLFSGTNGALDGVTLNGVTVQSTQNGGAIKILNTLTFANGATLDLAGGTNNFTGSVAVQTSAPAAGFAGVGQINLGANTSYSSISNFGGTNALVIGPGILIHGKYGQFSNRAVTDGPIVNQGTILADVPGGTFQFFGRFTNQGTVQAVPGANLALQTTQFVQTAGLFQSPGDVPNGGTFQLTGGTAVIGSLSGTGTVTVGNVAAGPTVTMTLGGIHQNAVTVQNTGVLAIAAGTSRLTQVVNALTLTNAGRLDLANQNLLTGTAAPTVRQYLANGYANGAWNGAATGGGLGAIVSSAAGTAGASLGYASSADVAAGAVSSATAAQIGAGQTLVMYTTPADFNLDGRTDFNDFLALQNHYNQAGDWTQGDANYDGKVDFNDFLVLQNNYNHQLPAAGAAPAVAGEATVLPEPTGAAWLFALTAATLGRRRRRDPRENGGEG